MFFQYDRFPHSHGSHGVAPPYPRLGRLPETQIAATPKKQPAPTIFKCRQSSAGNCTPTSPPRVRGQNPPPFGTEIRATQRSPHPNPLPRERGGICCESKKSSLHLEYLKCRLLFMRANPRDGKPHGTPIPPNQARYAFAAAAHTPNPAHR